MNTTPEAVRAWVQQVRAWTQYTTFTAPQVEAVELLCLALDQIDTLVAEGQALRASVASAAVGLGQSRVDRIAQLEAENTALKNDLFRWGYGEPSMTVCQDGHPPVRFRNPSDCVACPVCALRADLAAAVKLRAIVEQERDTYCADLAAMKERVEAAFRAGLRITINEYDAHDIEDREWDRYRSAQEGA